MTTQRSTRLRTFCSLHHERRSVNLPVSKKCLFCGIFVLKTCCHARACGISVAMTRCLMLIMLLLCAGMGAVSAQPLEDELLPEAEVGEALPEEEMTEVEKALRDTIHERGRELVDLLRKVQDAETAGKHAARIRELLLWEPDADVLEQVDEELLAVEFMESFEAIATELSRLAEHKFYGEESLQELMQYFEAELEEETP